MTGETARDDEGREGIELRNGGERDREDRIGRAEEEGGRRKRDLFCFLTNCNKREREKREKLREKSEEKSEY